MECYENAGSPSVSFYNIARVHKFIVGIMECYIFTLLPRREMNLLRREIKNKE
jgi:hypothetical protein